MTRADIPESTTRRKVISAAMRQFLEYGYSETSMDRIASEAAVSKVTLYNNFGSKDGVFAAIVSNAAKSIVKSLQSVSLHVEDSPRRTLSLLAENYARVLLSDKMIEFYRLAISEERRFPNVGRIYYEAGPMHVEATIQHYLSDFNRIGKLQVDDLELSAKHFWALCLTPLREQLVFGVARPDAIVVARYLEAGVNAFLRAHNYVDTD